jgi:hypothetical protein
VIYKDRQILKMEGKKSLFACSFVKKNDVFVCVCVCVCVCVNGWVGGCKIEEMNERAQCELENCISRSMTWGDDKKQYVIMPIFRSEWKRQVLGEGSCEQ